MKGGNNIKTLTVRLDNDLHRKFKIYSIEHGEDMQTLLIEFIKKLVAGNDQQAK